VIVGFLAEPERGSIDIFDTVGRRLVIAEAEDEVALRGDYEALQRGTLNVLARTPKADSWGTTHLNCCGRAKEFRSFALEDAWAAFAPLNRAWLYVRSRGADISDVSIVPVTDLAPYLGPSTPGA